MPTREAIEYCHLTVSLTPEQRERLDARRRLTGEALSSLIRRIVQEHLDRQDRRDDSAAE